MRSRTTDDFAPNHYADAAPLSGLSGALAGIGLLIGRRGDAKHAAEVTGLIGSDHVLDIGCGPGAAARNAARCGATVTGIDPAPVMVNLASRLTRDPSVIYLEGAAENLSLPDGTVTVAWTIASVHHWTDLNKALTEIRRVLTPEGHFVAVERHFNASDGTRDGWTDQQARTFANVCRQHGFADIRITRRSSRFRY